MSVLYNVKQKLNQYYNNKGSVNYHYFCIYHNISEYFRARLRLLFLLFES